MLKAFGFVGTNEIHKLSDSLLISIINELPIKDAIRTSVLAHKWRDLWKWIPSLNFNHNLGEKVGQKSQRLATIVKHVFSSHLGHISSCQILHYSYTREYDMAQWLEHLSKRGIHKLVLTCNDESVSTNNTQGWGCLYSTVVHCNSLQELELRSWWLMNATPLMGFCNLRTLKLRSVVLTEKSIMDIISNCAVLEWLALLDCNISPSVNIHAPKLKVLELKFLSCLNIDIDAPSLRTLAISSVRFRSIDINAASLTTLAISAVKFRYIKLEVPNIQIFRTDGFFEAHMDFLSQCVGLYGVSFCISPMIDSFSPD